MTKVAAGYLTLSHSLARGGLNYDVKSAEAEMASCRRAEARAALSVFKGRGRSSEKEQYHSCLTASHFSRSAPYSSSLVGDEIARRLAATTPRRTWTAAGIRESGGARSLEHPHTPHRVPQRHLGSLNENGLGKCSPVRTVSTIVIYRAEQ